jgi:mono/diheme cytochrome c family protein
MLRLFWPGSRIGAVLPVAAAAALLATTAWAQAPAPQQADSQAAGATLQQYCGGCHNATVKSGGVVINPAAFNQAGEAETWERVIRQLRAQSMPPPNMPRPDKATYDRVATFLETSLDRAAEAAPNPGELPHLVRLTRTEYKNAIRDLLALDNLPAEMDYTTLLPADNSSSAFDNIADLLFVSPAIMERYLDAAKKIARLAVGDPKMPLMVNIHRTSQQAPQDLSLPDLPVGTRGGLAVNSYFPLDGTYEFQLELSGAAREQHELEISIDGERKQAITVGGAGGGRGGRGGRGGGGNQFRIPVAAGPHKVAVTFLQKSEVLDESVLRPFARSRGTMPAVAGVTIRGPYDITGPGDTPSRQRIFSCRPVEAAGESACARQILTTLLRRAYRRPVTAEDLNDLLPFYEAGRAEAGFDAGIQSAIERLLVSPQFLYRIEVDPPDAAPGRAYRISDLELASRISFFLWSSIPDDELLEAAENGRLRQPAVLEAQITRMLADPRSASLVNNFAAQWLFLRDVRVKEPDLFVFRDFDDNVRAAFERETELFLDSVLREDRSVLELLTANYTFLNERLAKHYGVPNVQGGYFRKVTFPEGSPRGGLLGQGSILLLTSYSTRTSPVLRGKYVLENLLASPPPPPPPNVPSLVTEGKNSGEKLSLREAMVQHRQNAVCAGCHARMDPIGFALENYDAVGRWRDRDAGKPLDVKSTLADGREVDGIEGVKKLILSDPERFVTALTEKLLMYAIGRNVQYYDAPALRQIVRQSRAANYKFSSLVLGVVNSVPFQMRQPVRAKE